MHVGDTVPDWIPDPDDDFMLFYCTANNHVYSWDGANWIDRDAAGGQAFPVGAIYTSITGADPAIELGYGTWAAFGSGQVPVGFASGDPDFGTVEGTGGEKVHTLTETEIPSHAHGEQRFPTSTGSSSGFSSDTSMSGTPAAVTQTTQKTGGDGPHNNLQPYVVVYMWKRTA